MKLYEPSILWRILYLDNTSSSISYLGIKHISPSYFHRFNERKKEETKQVNNAWRGIHHKVSRITKSKKAKLLQYDLCYEGHVTVNEGRVSFSPRYSYDRIQSS